MFCDQQGGGGINGIMMAASGKFGLGGGAGGLQQTKANIDSLPDKVRQDTLRIFSIIGDRYYCMPMQNFRYM